MTVALTIDGLAAPIAPDNPCGDNLEDTPQLASFDAFRLFGQPVAYETAPDWNAVRALAEAGLTRSRDLRLLAHYAAAVLRTARVDSFVDQKLRQTGMIDDLTKSPKTSTHLGRGRRRDSFGREVRSRMNESPVRESSCLEGPSLVATLALALG